MFRASESPWWTSDQPEKVQIEPLQDLFLFAGKQGRIVFSAPVLGHSAPSVHHLIQPSACRRRCLLLGYQTGKERKGTGWVARGVTHAHTLVCVLRIQKSVRSRAGPRSEAGSARTSRALAGSVWFALLFGLSHLPLPCKAQRGPAEFERK